MQRSSTLEVRKHALADTRLSERDLPPLGEVEVLARVDRFALTANNIPYGVDGEKIGYWRFFPAADGWGVIPVWGFADVVASRHPEVPEGERLHGYLPMHPSRHARRRGQARTPGRRRAALRGATARLQQTAYRRVLTGEISPDRGVIVDLPGSG